MILYYFFFLFNPNNIPPEPASIKPKSPKLDASPVCGNLFGLEVVTLLFPSWLVFSLGLLSGFNSGVVAFELTVTVIVFTVVAPLLSVTL